MRQGVPAGPNIDRRHSNTQSLQQRRSAVLNRRRHTPKPKTSTQLERAKAVLRRTGKDVFDARISDSRYTDEVVVDCRKLAPKAVIELAWQVLLQEWVRNNELRRQHDLSPLPKPEL